MKKILFTFLVLFTALILCSFSAVFDDSNVTTNVTTNVTANVTTNVTTNTAANTTINIYTPIINYAIWKFDSIKEFKKFAANGFLPDDFIYYNQISIIGDYDFLFIPSNNYDFESYHYSLIDDKKVNFLLYIFHYDTEEVVLPEITKIKSTDMRTHTGVDKGVYRSGEIEYFIENEKLSSISWKSNGITYVLDGTDLSEYPDTTSTFIGKMLNLDTAHEALEELRSLPKDEVKWYENVAIIAGISVAVVCVGGICGYVVYKKRKTKSLSDEPGEE